MWNLKQLSAIFLQHQRHSGQASCRLALQFTLTSLVDMPELFYFGIFYNKSAWDLLSVIFTERLKVAVL